MTSLIHIPPAQSFFDIRDLDPTDRNSKLREAGRQFDPTKPGGKLEDLKIAAFEIRYCLVKGGCDITRPEVQKIVNEELENCFLKGGCDPSIPEVREKGLEYVKKAREVYNNTRSFAIDLAKFAVSMTDKTFLNGFISRNFGHVTNKDQLRRELESRGIVIYGHEINHDEYMSATMAGIASAASANPAPLIDYLRDLAVKSYETILINTVNAVDKAPVTLKQKYGNQLTTIKSSLTQSVNPIFIAESLAEYIMKGKTPSVPKLKGNLSSLSIKFGVLSYNRGEKFFDDRIPLPNTHQPYILIALPELTVEVDNIINQETKQYDEVLNEEDLGIILEEASYDEFGFNREYLDEEETYFNTFQEAYEGKKENQPETNPVVNSVTRPYCVDVSSRTGWTSFNLPRSFTKVASINGGWSVDSRSYAPVGPYGHTGQDAQALSPYNQYKHDQRFPFGALLVDIPNSGYIWVKEPQTLSQSISSTQIRINDADNALGDNGGSLNVCFGN